MYKVFINERPVFLTDLNGLQSFQGNFVCYGFSGKEELGFLYKEIATDKSEDCAVVIINEDVDKLIKDFESLFVLINAAGGIVLNDEDEMLFIRRNNRWDLPKGKVEEMEGFPECAVREVQEECGINEVRIVSEADITKHTYALDGIPILKYTYWFNMKYSLSERLVPQSAEGITEARWIPKKELANVLDDAYRSIKDLLN